MVRMSQDRNIWTSTVVQLASLVNRREVLRRTRVLSASESREMLQAVSAFGPWDRKDFSHDVNAVDGASWLVEARRGTRYHPMILINADREAIDRLATVFWQISRLDPHMLHEGTAIPQS